MMLNEGLMATPSSGARTEGVAAAILGVISAVPCLRIIRETQKAIDRQRAA